MPRLRVRTTGDGFGRTVAPLVRCSAVVWGGFGRAAASFARRGAAVWGRLRSGSRAACEVQCCCFGTAVMGMISQPEPCRLKVVLLGNRNAPASPARAVPPPTGGLAKRFSIAAPLPMRELVRAGCRAARRTLPTEGALRMGASRIALRCMGRVRQDAPVHPCPRRFRLKLHRAANSLNGSHTALCAPPQRRLRGVRGRAVHACPMCSPFSPFSGDAASSASCWRRSCASAFCRRRGKGTPARSRFSNMLSPSLAM